MEGAPPGPLLVTGAGLIGSLTACFAEQAGQRVVLLDIAPNEPAVRELGFTGRIVTGNVSDGAGLHALVREEGIRSVIHTAVAQSPALARNPRLAVDVNIGGAVNVLETARTCELSRVILAGSTTVTYGSFGLVRELGLSSIPEDLPVVRQRSLYAASKAAVEQFAGVYADRFDVDVVVLRFAAVLGNWGGALTLPTQAVLALARLAREEDLPATIDPLLTWSGIEEFIDARDCADAALAALRPGRLTQVVFNVAYPEAVTYADLVDTVQRRVPNRWQPALSPSSHGFAGYPVSRSALSDVSAASDVLAFRATRLLKDSVDWIIDVDEMQYKGQRKSFV